MKPLHAGGQLAKLNQNRAVRYTEFRACLRLSETTLLRFGPFEANTYTGELHRGGTRIKLAPQAFQILALFAGRPGELITREEIQRAVWPNETIVEFDHSINTAVKRIREALNDSRGEPQYLAQGVKIAWAYVFDAPGSTRKDRKQIFESGFESKKEAQDAEAERRIKEQRDFELGKATPTAVPGTLTGLLKEFFTQHGEKSLAGKTLQRYREMADYLDADLLAMQIPKIKPLHLSREWNRLRTSGGRGRRAGKPLSRKTVRNIAGLVSSAYTRGLRWGIAEVNPVPGSEPPIPKKKQGIALSVDQQEKLIAGATAPWGMDVFLELDAATGARRGELLGLQWTDLEGNHLMIGRSLSQVGQQVFLKEPKNKKFRVVTIPPSALKKLQAHRKKQQPQREHFGDSYQGITSSAIRTDRR